MKCCYLCNDELTEDNDHKEHIFQQALGGTLAVEGILCKNCGNVLGKDIDVGFTSIFKNYTSRLPINFDRKSNNSIKSEVCNIELLNFNEILECTMNEKSISVIRPYAFLNNNTLIVMCPVSWRKKQVEGFKNSQLKQFHLTNDNPVQIIQDLSHLHYQIYMPFKMDIDFYKKGMAKIAIGFAILKGIKRETLECVLDTLNNKIHDRLYFVPYYPCDFIHQAIEGIRFETENLDCLAHQIKLFNIGSELICYIELFGTFQCHILLSKNYTGEPVYHSYMQPLFQIKRKELECMLRPKDMMLYHHYLPPEYDIHNPHILKDINNGIRKKQHELNLDEYYKNLLSAIFMNYTLFQGGKIDLIQYKSLKDFFLTNQEFIMNNKLNIMIDLHHFLKDVRYIKMNVSDCDLASIQNYNSKKMEQLEILIKKIHRNNNHGIYKTDF